MKFPELITWLNEKVKRTPAYMVLVALAVGLLAGYGAVGFRLQGVRGRDARDELPVLDDGRLVGVVHMEDVIGRYRKEVLRR